MLAWLSVLSAHASMQGLAGIFDTSRLASSPDQLDAWVTKLSCLVTGIFIVSFGRAQLDLRSRLAHLDHALWFVVLILGTAIGGVVAALGVGHESGTLVGLLCLLMAIALFVAALRSRARLPGLNRSLTLAATAALASPAVFGIAAAEGALSMTAAAVITTLAVLAMTLLSTSLFRANMITESAQSTYAERMQPSRPDTNSSAGTEPPDRRTAPSQSDRELLQLRLLAGIKRSDLGHATLALIWVKLEGLDEAHRMLGREVVEALVHGVEQRIDRTIGGIPQVSRFGEANFTIVFEAVSGVDEVISWIEEIREALSLPVELGDGSIAINAGVGHALYPNDGGDPASLHRTAARRANRTTRSEQRLRPASAGQGVGRAIPA